MDYRAWLGIIIGYFALRLLWWLLRQERRGDYIYLHINFWGDCNYIVYNGKKYRPDTLERILNKYERG